MLRFLIPGIVIFLCPDSMGQPAKYKDASNTTITTIEIPLPAELKDPEKQFSGLFINNQQLFLLPECRRKDKHEAVIYSITLKALDSLISGGIETLPYTKYPLVGLDELAGKIKQAGGEFEGLEAIVTRDESVYFSVETKTSSPYCYLIKGTFKEGSVLLDNMILPVLKPINQNGSQVYNASFEGIAFFGDRLYCFYEYNDFEKANYIFHYNAALDPLSKDSVLISKLPFRITDVTNTGHMAVSAINYFYNGDGKDTVFRPQITDTINYPLVTTPGGFKNYCRLIHLEMKNDKWSYQVLGILPEAYTGYNWEGIAYYKNGYFLINDKYTRSKPYSTVLLYWKP